MIATLAVACGLAACSSDTDEGVKYSSELLCVKPTLTLTAVETTAQMAVEADCHWELTVENTGWSDLVATPMQGEGNATVTLNTTQNTTGHVRSATLTFTTRGGLRQTVALSQTLEGIAPPAFTAALTLADGSPTSTTAAFSFGYRAMSPLSDHGLCYSTTNTSPTLSDERLSLGTAPATAAATAQATLADLQPLTTYHVRAYLVSTLGSGTPVYNDNVVTLTTPGTVPGDDNPYPTLIPVVEMGSKEMWR